MSAPWTAAVAALTPWAWYRLNETSGAPQDSSGNGRHASLSAFGNPTYQQPPLVPSSTDKSMAFAGAVGPTSPSFAISAATGMTVAQVYKGTGAGAGVKPLWRTPGIAGVHAAANFIVYAWNGNVDTGVSASIIKDDVAHLIVTTYKSGQQRIYVDGALVASASGGMLDDNQAITLARNGGGDYLDGGFDEWIIDTGVWTATQVADLHTAWLGGTGVTGDLAATLPVPTVTLSGTYAAPAVAGSLAATLPVPTMEFAGTYAAPPVGALAATLPVPTVTLAGTYMAPASPTGSFDLTLPVPTVSLSGTYVGDAPAEIVRNGFGLVLDSSATVDVVPPLDSGSLTSTVALHIIAATVPVPTLVAGRPS